MPKLNREKLLEFIEFDQSEELDLETILDHCEVKDESFEDPEVIALPKRKRRKFYKSKLR